MTSRDPVGVSHSHGVDPQIGCLGVSEGQLGASEGKHTETQRYLIRNLEMLMKSNFL